MVWIFWLALKSISRNQIDFVNATLKNHLGFVKWTLNDTTSGLNSSKCVKSKVQSPKTWSPKSIVRSSKWLHLLCLMSDTKKQLVDDRATTYCLSCVFLFRIVYHLLFVTFFDWNELVRIFVSKTIVRYSIWILVTYVTADHGVKYGVSINNVNRILRIFDPSPSFVDTSIK